MKSLMISLEETTQDIVRIFNERIGYRYPKRRYNREELREVRNYYQSKK